jgi:iron(III) transport system ATP-binding protein
VLESDGQGEPRVRTALGSHALLCDGTAQQREVPGREVTVLVRPEQVTLSGGVAGTVSETSYHGHDALVAVDVAGIGTVRSRTSGATAPALGDKVSLGVADPVTAWPN